jgi:hypothetical protein
LAAIIDNSSSNRRRQRIMRLRNAIDNSSKCWYSIEVVDNVELENDGYIYMGVIGG